MDPLLRLKAESIDKLKRLLAAADGLLKALPDFDRIKSKVDGFTVNGNGVTFKNSPATMSLGVYPKQGDTTASGALRKTVRLTKTSGSDGTASAAPTWVYSAFQLDGTTAITSATGLSPEQQRPFGKTKFATIGDLIADPDAAGSYLLWWCDEVPNFAECTPP